MLGLCTLDLHFVYVLLGWEGSVTDGKVLRDAITRRHGLKVPNGKLSYDNRKVLKLFSVYKIINEINNLLTVI